MSSTVPKEIIKMIECSLNQDSHFVKDAILLPCGSNACKQCLLNINSKNDIKCYGCNKLHKFDELKDLWCNPTIDILIEKIYLKDLMEMIQSGFSDALKKLQNMNIEENINKNIEFVEFEIDIRIESLKTQLDNISEMFHGRLKDMKDKLNSIANNKIDSMRQYIEHIQRNFTASYENLHDYQLRLNECKYEIANFSKSIPQVVFESSDEAFEQNLFGKLYEKYHHKYEKIRTNKSFKLSTSKYLFSIVKNQKQKQLILTDTDENSLKIFDPVSRKCVRTIKSTQLYINKLSAICINNANNQIYLSDQVLKKILVFDENFKYIREFGDSNHVKTPDSMVIDNETGVLYITDFENNQITLWNSEYGKFIQQYKIDSPAQVFIHDDKLIIISENDYEHNKSTGRLKITKGSNSLFILNKTSMDILKKIKLDDWFDPCGLYVDANGNILTTAFELDQEKYISTHRLLYIFDSNGTFQNKIKLDNIENFSDMTFIDRKLYFCYYDTLKCIEFE